MNVLLQPIDLYCERIDTTFFSEPMNLFSNLAFVIAGILILRRSAKAALPKPRRDRSVLGGVAILVGFGSGLFHSIPNRLTQTADVLPIALYIILCVGYYFRQLQQKGVALATPITLCLGLLCLLPLLARIGGFSGYLNNGEFYLGLAPAILLLSYYEVDRARSRVLVVAALVFAAAFLARTLDPLVCQTFALGTHFLWHILAATVAFLMALTTAISTSKET